MHLFSSKQMDFNWDNEAVRKELFQIANWWLEKGIDGFRLDVISFISKKEGLPDGNAVIGSLMGFKGCEHYFCGNCGNILLASSMPLQWANAREPAFR